MAVKPVLKMGDPLLLQVAAPVARFNTPELDALIQDMFDTMAALNGAGLAAPQIGVALRVAIFGVEANPRYPEVEPVPMTVLINPAIQALGQESEDGWEGCLSVPGMRGMVSRYRRVPHSGFHPPRPPPERTVEDFHARVVRTNATTSTASSTPCASGTCACSVLRTCCFPGGAARRNSARPSSAQCPRRMRFTMGADSQQM